MKADRGKAIAWRSVRCHAITYQTKKYFEFSVCILYPLCSLQSTICTRSTFCIQSAVCSLQSAFCTNRYPWHQYSYSHNTHNLPQNTCVWVNSTFSFFSALILFPFVIHPPKKKTLACIACLCLYMCLCVLHVADPSEPLHLLYPLLASFHRLFPLQIIAENELRWVLG